MEMITVTAKTLDEAITKALIQLKRRFSGVYW